MAKTPSESKVKKMFKKGERVCLPAFETAPKNYGTIVGYSGNYTFIVDEDDVA